MENITSSQLPMTALRVEVKVEIYVTYGSAMNGFVTEKGLGRDR
jgi:hypothetical protein